MAQLDTLYGKYKELAQKVSANPSDVVLRKQKQEAWANYWNTLHDLNPVETQAEVVPPHITPPAPRMARREEPKPAI